MPYADFVHLRVHSAYSLSEGAIKIKDLVKLAAKNKMPAAAVTDTGNLFGALEFAMTALESGVQPIIGTVLGVTRVNPNAVKGAAPGKPLPPDQLVLLCQNETGYRNLMKLVSKAFLESDPAAGPQISLSALEGRSEGLIALTGGVYGGVGRLLSENQDDAAKSYLDRLEALFPGRLYIELQRHGGRFAALEDAIEDRLIDFAYGRNLPLVATNDVFFADEGMYEAHDALLCIAEGRYLREDDRRRVTPDHYFKSAAEMRDLFADLPEAIDNSMVVAKRCSFLLKTVKPILPAFPCEGSRSEEDELRAQAREGLERRLKTVVYAEGMDDAERERLRKEYFERLEFELDVIAGMKFPGYFLIVSDFIKWAKNHDIPVGPGRGSGAGSVVAWALLITDLDPIRFGLLFERFLNPERVSMPDFDVDFCQDRREEVIKYVQDKYGYDRVAQIITFGKLQARAVLRDVGRVLEMPYGQVDKICKLVPNNPANPVTLKDAIDGEPALQAARDGDETVAKLMSIALKLEGLYRHASTHAAGVVIGDRPLDELTPLYRDPRSDMPVTQFNMKYVELTGLVKFDFLGLKTLTVITTAVRHIPEEKRPNIETLPLDDEKTYRILGRAESTGVFQLESSGMRDVLKRLKPNRLEDIIALVSLYRPGPMDNIPKYIKVKNGEEKPDYMHPSLEGILKETFGIMIYQEQVMQIAQVLSGYSLGGADLLRRAMGKKIKAEMDKQREVFVEGAQKNSVPSEQSSMIFDQVMKFAGYGFNKSHAAAYALIAYQTAWLKANHPVAFMAASMTLDLGNTDKLNVFRQELTRLNIKLLTPDVNRSEPAFAVEDLGGGEQGIRYALAAVKGVGLQAMKNLVAERRRNGPFKSLFDFARRMDLKSINKRQLENLACAGAFDSLEKNRAKVHGNLETLLRYAHAVAAEKDSGMNSLFGGPGGEELKEPKLADPKGGNWDALEQLRQEFGAIGFYLSAHPLDAFTAPLNRLKVVRTADIARTLKSGTSTRRQMAGIVVSKQERTAKSGNRFAFVTLSDATGVFEVTLFQETLAVSRDLLEPGTAVFLTVDIQPNGEEYRLTCQEVKLLETAVAAASEGVRVTVDAAAAVAGLRELVDKLPRGRAKLLLTLDLDGAMETDLLLGTYSLSPQTRTAVKQIAGVVEVAEM